VSQGENIVEVKFDKKIIAPKSPLPGFMAKSKNDGC
jgi:hypothetical protein